MKPPLVSNLCPMHGLPRISGDDCQKCIDDERYNRSVSRVSYWLFGVVFVAMALLGFLAWFLNTPMGRAWIGPQP